MKKFYFIFTVIMIMFFMAGCDNKPSDDTGSNKNLLGTTFTWSNPISYPEEIDSGRGFRDPYIIKDGEYWYFIGTMYPYFEGDKGLPDHSPGVNLYKSSNLKDWEFVANILARPDPSENKWYQNYFWAPELFIHNGKYYLTVSCSKAMHYDTSAKGTDAIQSVCLAVADKIEGPYTVISDKSPVTVGNDAHLFEDDDGKIYMFVAGITAFQIDLDTGKKITTDKTVVSPVPKSTAWNAQRDGVGFEGPYVRKKNGTYYLFYSTWARGYEIGIAENTDGPLKKWTLLPDPFYGAMNQEACDYYGATYEAGYYVHDYREAGHNSVFLGPDGNDWIAAHVFEEGDADTDVKLVIDRLYYGDDGSIYVMDSATQSRVNGPTYGPQSVDISNPVIASPVKALDIWGWRNVGVEYQLPEKVDVLFDNGWRESYPAVWDSTVDTSTKGTVEVTGKVTCDDQTYECKATVV
ncbi:MAG: family 43 glycosylhydrolase, partial [Clostridiales bacterium]|nr:family 43 glycosylhydrolase [Clostridiales bacterium]